jgi:hypothetical protein
MWAEGTGKLECMDSANRERLWPQLVQRSTDLLISFRYSVGIYALLGFDGTMEI